jgi:hypothetical protein
MNDRAVGRAVSESVTPKHIRSMLRGIPHPAKAGQKGREEFPA